MDKRRFAVGAEPQGEHGTSFRVWAPAARRVEVVGRRLGVAQPGPGYVLDPESGGYFSGFVGNLGHGNLYSLRLDGKEALYPDPASRFQPCGPHGPSQVVDAGRYEWKDKGFPGTLERGQVIYELHIGTFTREGTYAAATRELSHLQDVGVTTLELMPLAEFPGEFGWGYDGVDLWAPPHAYGQPDELRAFIDRAHALGLAVILDVVYNHFGPDGCYLKAFSPHYFTDKYKNEWGEPLNFDGESSGAVREFFCENARYWLAEYHFDGLRLDATQSIFDASERHVIADITSAARREAASRGRRIYIAAENEPQLPVLVGDPAAQQGYGCDALWNDDFHHTAQVALTGRREAYYADYRGSPQELISALKWGYLFQGQHYFWQNKRRGESSLALGAQSFVTYLQNHDQVANSLDGQRITHLSSAALVRALTALWLLGPATPLLFQGQEFAASSPFYYFADHNPELAQQVRKGRQEFLAQFPSLAPAAVNERIPDPKARSTFEACKLDHGERERNAPWFALHKDLLALRRGDPAFCAQRADLMHGSVLSSEALALRFFCDAGDRLLVLNMGADLALNPAPEPLLAPPAGHSWQLAFCSEDVRYGGGGFVPAFAQGLWTLTARSASAFVALADAR